MYLQRVVFRYYNINLYRVWSFKGTNGYICFCYAVVKGKFVFSFSTVYYCINTKISASTIRYAWASLQCLTVTNIPILPCLRYPRISLLCLNTTTIPMITKMFVAYVYSVTCKKSSLQFHITIISSSLKRRVHNRCG